MALTQKDIKNLAEIFATKDDLKSFATKDDLKSFATKDDLKRFATKDDLERFVTKEEFNQRFDELIGHIDWLTKAFKDMKEELTIRFGQYRRHEAQLEDHEKRIQILESKVLVS